MIRGNLGAAMQGLAVVPAVRRLRPRRAGTGPDLHLRRHRRPVRGARLPQRRLRLGVRPRLAEEALAARPRPATRPSPCAVEALYDAADDDSATGGPDLVRRIFPVVATVTDAGYQRVPDDEVGRWPTLIVGRARPTAPPVETEVDRPMTMPFYVSPEQIMRDRAEYARKGIARGRSVVVLSYDGGIAVRRREPVAALHKVSEIYDRIAFAAVGKYNEFENLRVAGRAATPTCAATPTTAPTSPRAAWPTPTRRPSAAMFTTEPKPLEVELCVAEVGGDAGRRPDLPDQLRRVRRRRARLRGDGRPGGPDRDGARGALRERAEPVRGARRSPSSCSARDAAAATAPPLGARPSSRWPCWTGSARGGRSGGSPGSLLERLLRGPTTPPATCRTPTTRGRAVHDTLTGRRATQRATPPRLHDGSTSGARHRDPSRAGPARCRCRRAPPRVGAMDRRIFGIETSSASPAPSRASASCRPTRWPATCSARSCRGAGRATSSCATAPGSTSTWARTRSTRRPSATTSASWSCTTGRGSGSSRACMVDAERRLHEEGIAGEVFLFKNNTDSAGNSYGCHENYLVEPARRVRAAGRRADPVPGHPPAHLRRGQGAADAAGRGLLPVPAGRPHLGGRVQRDHPVPADHQHPRRAARGRREVPPAARHRGRLEHGRADHAAQGRQHATSCCA